MIILGIDPGYAIVGYGVIEANAGKYRPISYGAILTEAGEDFNRRLCVIYDDLSEIIRRYRPQAVSIEKLFYHTNQKTVIGVAEARGVTLLAIEQNSIPIYEYTPLQVKTAVTGYGRAEKKQIMEMTRRLLGLSELPKPDDAADALALAICHGQHLGAVYRQNLIGG